MTEVYIQGKEGYKEKVRKALQKSYLVEGDHYIEGVNSLHEQHETSLYWKTNNSRLTLKEFKQAIGAQLIWDYRLRFYESVDQLPTVDKKSNEITDKDIKLMEEYRRSRILRSEPVS